ncbi:MAG: hypothetical protein U9Q63_03590 [Patescibacteria group bacterium]|nr:hypothetical protein [Patescibacteria group bacterium]
MKNSPPSKPQLPPTLKSTSNPSLPTTNIPEPKKSKKIFFLVSLLLLVILSISGSIYYFKFLKPNAASIPQSGQSERKTTFVDLFNFSEQKINQENVLKKDSNYTLQTGFKIFVPDTWTSETSIHTKDHFSTTFIPESDPNSIITIESGDPSTLVENPLFSFEQTETKLINNIDVEIKTGKENFSQSNRSIKKVIYKSDSNKVLVATLASTSTGNNQEFETFLSSITLSNQPQTFKESLFPKVYAQETIGGFAKDQFRNLLVMWDPLPERLFNSSKMYKDSKAHLYAFESLKGERLKIVALEDQSNYQVNFIRIDFFHQDGKMYNTFETNGPTQLLDPSDPKVKTGYSSASRFQLKAPYTGWYYFIVYSNCQDNCQPENIETKLEGYSMEDQCGEGMYYKATVRCYSGHTEQILLTTCTHQSDNTWMKQAQTICNNNSPANDTIDLSQLAYVLKILDLNQVENINGVKFSNGTEKIIDPYIADSVKVGPKSIALTVRFTNPVDITNNNQVRYYSKPKELEPSQGIINSNLSVYIRPETYQQFVQNAGTIPFPEESNQKVPIKIYSLGSHTVLIQSIDGHLFPSGHHIVLVETNIKTGEKIDTRRIFTE